MAKWNIYEGEISMRFRFCSFYLTQDANNGFTLNDHYMNEPT
jgi:hypothetical protein